jgi:hypothetical protein
MRYGGFSLHAVVRRSSRPAHVVAVTHRRTSPGAPVRRHVGSTAVPVRAVVRRFQPAPRSTTESPWARGRSNSSSYVGAPAWHVVVRALAVGHRGTTEISRPARAPVHRQPSVLIPTVAVRPAGGIFHPWRVTSRQSTHNPPAAGRPTTRGGWMPTAGAARRGPGRSRACRALPVGSRSAGARRRYVVVLRCSGRVRFVGRQRLGVGWSTCRRWWCGRR